MTEKLYCDNCGQGALPDDTHCWQCGRPLPLPEAPALVLPAGDDPDAAPRRWSMTAVYTVLTGIVVALALLVLFILGRQPKVQATSWIVDDDFRFVAAANGSFAVALPQEWTWLDAALPDQQAELELRLAAGLAPALQPWPRLVSDLEVEMLAEAPEDGGGGAFLLVGRTAALAGEPPEVIMAALRRQAIGDSMTLYEDFDRTHLAIEGRVPAVAPRSECHQWVHPGRQQTLLAVFCVPDVGAARVHRENIRQSLQNFR